MIRFQQAPNPLLSGAIVLLLAAIFVFDFYTPLGITVWVLYLVPVVLAYLDAAIRQALADEGVPR